MKSPDRWVLIETPKCVKVFGSWAGGYGGSDAWQLNSGIEIVSENDIAYFFHGYSGSVYRCHKEAYGVVTNYAKNVLDGFLRREGVSFMTSDEMERYVNERLTT